MLEGNDSTDALLLRSCPSEADAAMAALAAEERRFSIAACASSRLADALRACSCSGGAHACAHDSAPTCSRVEHASHPVPAHIHNKHTRWV